MKRILQLLLATVITLGFAACGGSSDEAKSDQKTITMNLAAEPGSLDSALLTDALGAQVENVMSEGLTKTAKDGTTIAAGAESWDVNGLVYTFHLRKAAKWSNGTPVTANDYAFAWKRVLEPETASQYAYIMYPIKGAKAYNEGTEKDFNNVGIKVIDDYTLEVTLEKPAAYFASTLSFGTYLPVNEAYFNEKGDDYALESDDLIYNGRYVISKWSHGEKIEFAPNEQYWDKANTKVDKITFLMIKDTSTALKMYENGQLDMVTLDGDGLAKYKDSEDLVTYSDGSIWYSAVNINRKPFNNKKVRQALNMGIDRKSLVDNLKKDGSLEARYFVPEGVAGPNGKTFREAYGREIFSKVNPEKAKALLVEGLKEEGMTAKDFKMTLTVGNSDTAQKEAQFYQEQLNKNLGINVQLEPVTFQIRLQKQANQDFDVVLSGWSPDYNDPLTFMDMWVTGGGNNDMKWSNAEYDELIKTAQNSTDNQLRMDDMAKAERILADESIIVPTYSRARNVLVSKKIKNMRFGAVGSETRFDDVDVDNTAK